MRKLHLALAFLIIVEFFGLHFYTVSNADTEMPQNIMPVLELKPAKDTALLTFAGDVMVDRGVKGSVNKNFDGDYAELFKNVDIFKNDDISFINLEGPVADSGHKVGSIYSFRMDPKIIPILKNIGIDIVSFANNHVGDYTKTAFKETLDNLYLNGILRSGAGYNYEDAKQVKVIEVNNIKIGFIGFSDVGPVWMKADENNPGIILADDKNFTDIIKTAKENVDVLVVSFHWGEEYKTHNKRQEDLAHSAIDSGANIIVGHHPHVAQDIEYYKGSPILYSLGNFMFDQYFSPETMSGLVVQIEINKKGEIKNLEKFISKQNKSFQIESITKTN